jgi:hypothetical protein
MKRRTTVAELARRVLPEADDDELASVVRQLRYWTVSRVIPTVREGRILTGRGHHRGYDEATVPLVAVAVELARWRMAMETIRLVLAELHARTKEEEEPRRRLRAALQAARTKDPAPGAAVAASSRDRELWTAALSGREGVFLVLKIPLEAADGVEVNIETSDGLARQLVNPRQLSTVVVALSRLFPRLR